MKSDAVATDTALQPTSEVDAPRLTVAGGAVAASLGEGLGSFVNQADAPSCMDCGAIMVRNGACYKCLNCGSTSGCS